MTKNLPLHYQKHGLIVSETIWIEPGGQGIWVLVKAIW